MQTNTVEAPTAGTQESQAQTCQCEAQIAGILARLEALERDGLTVEKLREMPPSTIIQRLMA